MLIMLCYDGSNTVKEGIYEAIKLAQALKGKILVVTCSSRLDKDYPKIIEPLSQGLKEAKSTIDQSGVPCESALLYRAAEDSDGEALLSFAREKQVSYIIIGIRNRSKVGKLLFGSVAQYVLLGSEVPVIGVKRKK